MNQSSNQPAKKSKMNLPNKLTVLRILMVPVFVVVMMLPASLVSSTVTGIVGVVLFILASLTDMLDGKLARTMNLITNGMTASDPSSSGHCCWSSSGSWQ